MMKKIKRYKRPLVAFLAFLLLFVLGASSMVADVELAGSLFIALALFTVGYFLLSWILHRKKQLKTSENKAKKELNVLILLISIISIIGAFESSSINEGHSFFYWLLILYQAVFFSVLARNRFLTKHGRPTMKTSTLRSIVFWLFSLGIGALLLILESYNSDDPFITVGLLYFPILIFLVIRWFFNQIKSVLHLKNEQTKTELLHLKSQINPHFFFNMLNNLYGLVEKDSKKAQQLILKLSEMMRYSIYEGQKDEVTLEQEIEYLEAFIELHKMRYHKSIDVQFTKDIQQENIKIMPLLFIILLENAFKHGVENLIKDAYIKVSIQTESNQLYFKVENNFDASELPENPGIGLKNLSRRLELVYPKKHILSLSKDKEVYYATLSLMLA